MNRSPVAAVRCRRYEDVAEALPRLLGLLGGMGRHVRPGQSVLIKPNLLSDHPLDHAVTTHPDVVRGVIRAVKEAGAKPWVADSPANVKDLARVWQASGIEAVCAAEGVPLVNLEKAGSERVVRDGCTFTIARPVLEADAIITVPKFKTHVLTRFTGAVKNLYGTVPGFQKTALHKAYPKPDAFCAMLMAVYRHVKPVLAVADAVVGMEGNGPSGGKPVALGFLAASADPVALDVAGCHRFGLAVEGVPYLRHARERGDGQTQWAEIDRVGDVDVWDDKPACLLPASVPLQRVPDWVLAMLGPLLRHRPAFSEACVFCGQCVKACPAGALTLRPRSRPVLDAAKCIECCCCHEICAARAIEMRAAWPIRAWHAVSRRS